MGSNWKASMPERREPVGRRFASLTEAAEYVGGCHARTIRRMITRGDLTGYRVPGSRLLRVDLNELDAAMRPVPAEPVRGVS